MGPEPDTGFLGTNLRSWVSVSFCGVDFPEYRRIILSFCVFEYREVCILRYRLAKRDSRDAQIQSEFFSEVCNGAHSHLLGWVAADALREKHILVGTERVSEWVGKGQKKIRRKRDAEGTNL